ncbi:MAG: hypothetical protein WCT25_02160 [Candidatus Paceibacterota bacterium]|jgi:hypothetical protein
MVRLQLVISDEEAATLEATRRRLGHSTMKAYFNDAFCLLEFAIQQTEEGREIGTFNSGRNSFRALAIPALITVRRKAEMAKLAGSFRAPTTEKG